MDEGGNWNLVTIGNRFPPHATDNILKIPLSNNNCDDVPLWKGSSCGNFSVSKAYELVSRQDSPNVHWHWIWKLKISQKIKCFLWKIFHKKLLTNAM